MTETSPTRMNLLTRRSQHALAVRGVDLLQKKRDALVREFFSLVHETLQARRQLNAAEREAHMALIAIDPGTGKVEIPEYFVAHDCGTVINPLIVKGMMLGGIAHGIGAALYEKFEYDESGQHLSGTFMDYLLPSSLEIPMVKIAGHCTQIGRAHV